MMKASLTRLGILCLSLASLVGCDCCQPEWPGDDPPQIQSVSISPILSLMILDHEQEFEAVALSTDGDQFDPMDYDDEGYEILWDVTHVADLAVTGGSTVTAPVGVALSGDGENPVLAMVTDPELGRFILRVKVLYQGFAFPDELDIRVEAVLPPPESDRVRVKLTPGTAGAVLNGCELTHSAGVEQRTMESWDLVEVGEVANLEKNYTEASCARHNQFAIAAPFSRLILNDGTYDTQSFLAGVNWASPVWTDAMGDELNASESTWWLEPSEIDLFVYNYTGNSDISAAMQTQLNYANKVYGESRVGIKFNIPHSHNEVTAPIASCVETYVVKPTADGGLGVQISSTRLNVVVLDSELPSSSHGWTCPAFETYPGRLLFLHWSDVQLPGGGGGPERPALLAHELGHVLAHDRPRLKNGWEHVGNPSGTFDGFQKSNVMHPKENGFPRDHLTIGQGFRMNVDFKSWAQVEPGIQPHHPGRTCGQEPYCSDLCPPLHRDVNEEALTVGSCPAGSSASEESEI